MQLLAPFAADVIDLLTQAAPFLAGAGAAAAAALGGAAVLARRGAAPAGQADPVAGAAFLFDGEHLRDANAAGWDLIARTGGATTREAVIGLLARSYPGLRAHLSGAAGEAAEGTVPERECGRPPARFEREGSRLRLVVPVAEGSLAVGGPREEGVVIDAAIFSAMEDELDALRTAIDAVPAPVWRTEPDGSVSWANAAYLDRAAGDPGSWPPPALFDPAEMDDLPPPESPRRLRAAAADGGWFDVSRPLENVPVHCAMPADEAVAAEASLRGFAMALADTFAHLPIGLAVFDSSGRLKLFNPALADLTEVPAGTLAARPSLRDLLDRMRESRLLAEPDDWTEWKERISRLESDARTGTYLETWDIEGGRTWRVAGRPHPGGAIALLIEDISSEVMLTRRFRAEIETGRALADAMPEAVAVFGREGVLLTSNAAYAEMWGVDPRTALRELTITDACRTWMAATRPSGVWGELRDAVTGSTARAEWSGEVGTGTDRIVCRCVPLTGGSTLIAFRRPAGAPAMRLVDAAPESETTRIAAE